MRLRYHLSNFFHHLLSILYYLVNYVMAWTMLFIARIIVLTLMRITVDGKENIDLDGPFIVTANHFSWFDAPLLTIYLPNRPAFLVANESTRFWFVRLYLRVFKGIPIWRGQPDRIALQTALHRLEDGKPIGIFPEGGIDPQLQEQRDRGEEITTSYGHTSRSNAQLIHGQPGTAYLAIRSRAPILPVGLMGTEKVLSNMFRFRRTNVTVRVGEAFVAIETEPNLDRVQRRKHMNQMSEEIMMRIAELFPPEKRGPYRRRRDAEMSA